MENTFPTQAELDNISKAKSDAEKRYFDAERTFKADYQKRKDEVAKKRADIDAKIGELRKKHDEAMQAVGVAIAEGLDGDLETERADTIAAELFKLEQRAKALATITVKADDALFDAVLTAYKELRTASDTARISYNRFQERAKAAADHFKKLCDDASKNNYWASLAYVDDSIVTFYESVRGPLNCPSYQKARAIAEM